MAKVLSKKDSLASKTLSGWDKAISDAKKGIEKFKAVIAHCEEMRTSGEPWPGDQKN
jgi:hypothetical protein